WGSGRASPAPEGRRTGGPARVGRPDRVEHPLGPRVAEPRARTAPAGRALARASASAPPHAGLRCALPGMDGDGTEAGPRVPAGTRLADLLRGTAVAIARRDGPRAGGP